MTALAALVPCALAVLGGEPPGPLFGEQGGANLREGHLRRGERSTTEFAVEEGAIRLRHQKLHEDAGVDVHGWPADHQPRPSRSARISSSAEGPRIGAGIWARWRAAPPKGLRPGFNA